MTKILSACRSKGGHPAYSDTDGKPRLGSHLREVYDALRRGEVVCERGRDRQKASYDVLRIMYGMEIEKVFAATGPFKKHVVGVRLVGEWEGETFVPIERITAGVAG